MRFQASTPYVTTSIAAGTNAAIDITIGPSLFNLAQILIVPSAGSGNSRAEIYNTSAGAAAGTDAGRVWGTDDIAGTIFDPMEWVNGQDPVPRNQGFIEPYADLDVAGQLHLKLYNNDSVDKTYAVTITYEETILVSSEGYVGLGRIPGESLDEQIVMPGSGFLASLSVDFGRTIRLIGFDDQDSDNVFVDPDGFGTRFGGAVFFLDTDRFLYSAGEFDILIFNENVANFTVNGLGVTIATGSNVCLALTPTVLSNYVGVSFSVEGQDQWCIGYKVADSSFHFNHGGNFAGSDALVLDGHGNVVIDGRTTQTLKLSHNASAPATSLAVLPETIYGSGSAVMGAPVDWILVNVAGVERKIGVYAV